MRTPFFLCCLLLLCISPSHGADDVAPKIWDFSSAEDFLNWPDMNDLKKAETLVIARMTERDRKAVLARIRELPNLAMLHFRRGSDLSQIDDKDPVPERATDLVLDEGVKISQSTIRWLARFPSGTTLVIGCNARHLDFDLGKFSWIVFDTCEISSSAIVKLVKNKKLQDVRFKWVTVIDDE